MEWWDLHVGGEETNGILEYKWVRRIRSDYIIRLKRSIGEVIIQLSISEIEAALGVTYSS